MDILKKIGKAILIFMAVTFPIEITMELLDSPELRLYRFFPLVRLIGVILAIYLVTRNQSDEPGQKK